MARDEYDIVQDVLTPVKAFSTGDLFAALNHVETAAAAVIGLVSDMTDDEVLMTRDYAREVGKAAWRIECACDAEILKRTHARRGRGNKDVEGMGVKATVASVAAGAGVKPQTIFRNAQIHNTFFGNESENGLSTQTILPEKQFYEEALRTANPRAAIQVMAARKDENPFFSPSDARKEIEAAERAEQVELVNNATLPEGKFHVIVSDPPWQYDKRAEDPTHRGACPYPTMTTEAICAMPVHLRANDDCVLWLWTTNAFMLDSYAVAEAWGFSVKTILTWAKDRMGVGDWLRGQTEHCLMCVKGKPLVTLTNQTTLLNGPMREHSRKPDEFYALVEKLCHGTKLEMFSREPRLGWTSCGAEVEMFTK